MLADDERTDQFIFKNVFDEISSYKVKQRVKPKNKDIMTYWVVNGVCLVFSIGLMTSHIFLNGHLTKQLEDKEGDPADLERSMTLNKVFYAFLITVLAQVYKH